MNSTLSLVLIIFITNASAIRTYRVIKGYDDIDNEFPYVVSILRVNGGTLERASTGSLLAPQWVLTAAHCFFPPPMIVRYGNMSGSYKGTKSLRKILLRVMPPNYKLQYHKTNLDLTFTRDDIGLLMIEEIFMNFGKLSAIDYKALTGYRVRFAGFGLTTDIEGLSTYEVLQVYEADSQRPLQVGEGMIVTCDHDEFNWGPAVCVIAKCTARDNRANYGDSGGPLFFRGKILAVASARLHNNEVLFTPVSSYLDWIYTVMNLPYSDYTTLLPSDDRHIND